MDITKDSFSKEVLQHNGVSLVDFWAQWCGPCRMMGPIIEALAKEFQGRANIVKVNVDENRELAQEYDVMSLPTFIFFKDGLAVERIIGAVGREQIIQALNVLL